MGIISDILEANKERVGQILSVAPYIRFAGPEPSLRTVSCPLCSSFLRDESDLQKHILSAHSNLQSYLRLNGEVLQDVHYTEEAISELLVTTLGEANGTITITMSEGLSKTWPLQRGEPRELSSVIPRKYKGIVQLTIEIAQFKKEFTVYCKTQPTLDLSMLDNAIGELQLDLGRGKEPAWSR